MTSKLHVVGTDNRPEILTKEALALIEHLHTHFNDERMTLLADRQKRQQRFDQGEVPHFLDDHPAMQGNWRVAAIPSDISERRVEITGPVSDAKMVINMLSPGPQGVSADMAMLDFEDSMKPLWNNVLDGVQNVIGAIRGDLSYTRPAEGQSLEKIYRLNPARMAHVMIRIRGLHLGESNVQVEGQAVAGGMLDLVLCALHTAKMQLAKRNTPMFYVPKCEHYLEARWWHRLFSETEHQLDLPYGSLRTTFLIETLPAAFQAEPILFEIRDRACGLNGGRWDKIFSDIKTLKMHKDRVMADRSTIDMTRPWMDAYAKHLIRVCHKHGAFAMGGMSAFTPGKDEKTRAAQSTKVLADKAREAEIGHDGCWVSHPYFIASARAQFKEKNQLHRLLEDLHPRPDLLPKSDGPKTLTGLRTNVRVSIAYMHGWQKGLGCVSFDNLMEDLATFEISRAQTWQWLHHKISLDDGTLVSRSLVQQLFEEEAQKIGREWLADRQPDEAATAGKELVAEIARAKEEAHRIFVKEELDEFLSMASELAK